MRSTLRYATALVLALALGLQWGAFQTIAWTGMIIANARTAPLATAVARTFDGRHPCPMCKAVEQARDQQQQNPKSQLKPGRELDSGLAWEPVTFDLACACEPLPVSHPTSSTRRDEPPKPRPRTA